VTAEGLESGLAAQAEALHRRVDAGDELLGWKVGLNAAPVQAALGLDGVVVGFVTTASEVEAGAPHSLADASNPGVEPELAVRFGAELPDDASPEQVAAAVDAFAPALELVDLDRPLDDLHAILADNVFHRGLLLGSFDTGRAGADLEGLEVAVRRNGEEAGAVSVADAYADLARTLRFVSIRLRVMGETLRAGQFVIAGSLTPIVPVGPGDEVRADFGPLGGLEIAFTE
jgi:2-oxo-3-hexenedioate decarboxylase